MAGYIDCPRGLLAIAGLIAYPLTSSTCLGLGGLALIEFLGIFEV